MINGLKVRTVNKCENVTVQIDHYVPFTLEFGSANRRDCFYYRFGNGSTSVLEFGIDKHSFTPKNITLLSLDSAEILSGYLPLEEATINVTGLPVINNEQAGCEPLVKFAAQNRITVKSTLNLYLSESSVLVTFNEYVEPSHIYINDTVRFLINDSNELVGIEILELSEDSIETMKSALI